SEKKSTKDTEHDTKATTKLASEKGELKTQKIILIIGVISIAALSSIDADLAEKYSLKPQKVQNFLLGQIKRQFPDLDVRKINETVDLTELEQLADWILPYLKPNIFLLLQGDLGAGKTTFTQILARKLGIKNTRLLGGRFSANSSLGSAFAGFFADKGYEKHNISEIINEAEKVGVKYILNTGQDMPTNNLLLTQLKNFPNLFGSLGLHPNSKEDLNEENLK
ncbi:5559_t:CDS:2, partial [Entrophospora sp. SA101]